MSDDGDDVPNAPSVTYEIGELYRTVDELEGMFAELKYIDDALGYWARRKPSGGRATASSTLAPST